MDLIICEIFNKNVHGLDNNSDPNVQEHYLVIENFTKNVKENDDEYYDNEDNYDNTSDSDNNNDNKYKLRCKYNNYQNVVQSYKQHLNKNIRHPFVRNYSAIIRNPNYIQLHIAKVIYLSGKECVAILKTFWIKIIQRTWKKIYKQRCNIIRIRALPISQNYRQQNNKWPDNCSYLPSIQGMLSNN
jgi:hypothetical protein